MTPAAALAMPLRATMPRWAVMWAIAVALYAGCKWLTFRDVRVGTTRIDRWRALAYLLAWPGMDAAAFLSKTTLGTTRPARSEWIAAALKTLLGAALVWLVARTALPGHPLVAGWVAMAGLIFLLHCGTFHLLSLGWRSLGVDALPVMRNPLRSTSLAEFWGRRWNTAFHEVAVRFTFRPLRRAFGPGAAAFLVFLVSGLVHELVISVPAGGGYGLPTMYFLVQAIGIAAERTQLGRRLGLGRGVRGWVFAMIVTAGPAFWLFAPPFVHEIVLPMLAAIGAG